MKSGKKGWVIPAAVICVLLAGSMIAMAKSKIANFNKDSLHRTGAGMKYWYDAGFKKMAGLEYEELDCKSCHVASCDKCHAEKKGKSAREDVGICFKCHSREATTFKMDEATGALDVHRAKGMVCADCHIGDAHDDVHGNDGGPFKTMRDPGAVQAKCTNCHEENQKVESHKIHGGKLDCAACHIKSSVSCMNCHFDSFLETGKRPGNFVSAKSWLILVNHEGKVTSGSAMSLVSGGKKFISYQPYFTHSVQKQAKKCEDCHGNEAMKLIADGKKVPMMTFVNGEVKQWSGVVPCSPDDLEWAFLDKKDGNWSLIDNDEKPVVQMVGYGEPLTKQQMEALGKTYQSGQ